MDGGNPMDSGEPKSRTFVLGKASMKVEQSMIITKAIYAPQTKILENGTGGRACVFDGLCEGS